MSYKFTLSIVKSKFVNVCLALCALIDVSNMSYFVYVLFNEGSGRYYRGMTKNLDLRLAEHNAGKMKSTKAFVPWKMVYSEECKSRLEARKREKFLKSGDGRAYVESLL